MTQGRSGCHENENGPDENKTREFFFLGAPLEEEDFLTMHACYCAMALETLLIGPPSVPRATRQNVNE